MRNNIPLPILSYLEKRGAKHWLNVIPHPKFKIVVVIPAIKEFKNIPHLLNSLSKNCSHSKKNTLILFSINNSNESSEDIIENNKQTIDYLSKLKGRDNQYGLNIDYVDASTPGKELPAKDAGVGLARKIGMDQSLYYLDYGQNNNLIVCLDADCEVESNYLEEIHKCSDDGIKAGVIKYAHQLENEAIVNYEIFLRYYVLGLKLAGSPYAYHSIGSCIVIDPFTYAKIGGMNKKKAGEDFYFLEKAAKHVPVLSIDTTTVFPSCRKSWRVPFGTGQRMNRFYERVRDEYVLYNPNSFILLKNFLEIYFNKKNISPSDLLSEANLISPSLMRFLTADNFENSLQKIIENSKSTEQLNHQKKLWFDSFKTLKLIHHLRDDGYPEKPMFSALNELFDILHVANFEKHTSPGIPTFEKEVEYLTLLRKLT